MSDAGKAAVAQEPLSEDGLSRPEIMRIVNRYIGVSGGYLGDFSYRTHAEFYPEYCDLEIDPYEHEGTTRERFIRILSSLSPRNQARVLRGVLERFPVGDGPATRNDGSRNELLGIIARLESGPLVPGVTPRINSEVVAHALTDAEALLASSGPVSAIDRVHTALHGYLMAVCDDAALNYPDRASMTALFKVLRSAHPRLSDLGPRAQEIEKVLNSCANIFDAMNPVRNRASVAHPNRALLENHEARLVINVGRSLLSYLDAKLAGAPEAG